MYIFTVLDQFRFLCCVTFIFTFQTMMHDSRPYLKSFISRVRTKHRERFSSFSRYATRLSVEAFFLTALHRAVSTKAVKRSLLLLARVMQYLGTSQPASTVSLNSST